MVLTGLRGVGKTVLLNALRGQAVQRAWGTGKIEARPDQSIRIPVAQAVHAAVREVGHRHRDPDRVDEVAGVLKAFALRTALDGPQGRCAGRRRSTYPPRKGRADSGDLELDLTELFTDVAAAGRRPRRGHRAVRRRDAGHRGRRARRALRRLPRDQPAGRAADRRRRRAAAPAGRAGGVEVVRRAAVPLRRVDRLAPRRWPTGRWPLPGRRRGRRLRRRRRWTSCYAADRRLPLLRPGLRQGHLGRRRRAPRSPRADVLAAAPEAEAELAVGFFGARYERATPAERDYMRAMADLGADARATAAGHAPPTWPGTSAASRSRSRPPATG